MDLTKVPRCEYPITIREIGPFDAECASVGMVVRAPTGKILLLDRLKGIYGGVDSPNSECDPGLGYACPAGHIEKDEHPFYAGLRELEEETGINKALKSASIVLEFWASNPCRKAKNHHWYIMLIETDRELGAVMEPTKHASLTWTDPDVAICFDLEPAWRAILGLMKQKGML